MDLLENVVQRYAWGSHDAIASLQGRSVTVHPEAELWMGAHPSAPSTTIRGDERRTLLDRIALAPEAELGDATVREFGPRLPFLLKVLAAAQPLSLQVHPSDEQARAGFDAEESKGVPRDAPFRNYKDPNAKPELLCALGPFVALSGFRAVARTRELFEALAGAGAGEALAGLRTQLSRGDLRSAFTMLMRTPVDARIDLVRPTLEACARIADGGGDFAEECRWALRIGALHGDDPGVVSALLLDLVHLQAGEAIYLDAGNLHAYLEGVGIEIMGNSDNVLRGGLTPKHVDVDELLRIVDFRDDAPPRVQARALSDHEDVWDTPARAFRLSRIRPGLRARPWGPEILLCTEGSANVTDDEGTLVLRKGSSAFVPGSTARYSVDGSGMIFRAAIAPPS